MSNKYDGYIYRETSNIYSFYNKHKNPLFHVVANDNIKNGVELLEALSEKKIIIKHSDDIEEHDNHFMITTKVPLCFMNKLGIKRFIVQKEKEDVDTYKVIINQRDNSTSLYNYIKEKQTAYNTLVHTSNGTFNICLDPAYSFSVSDLYPWLKTLPKRHMLVNLSTTTYVEIWGNQKAFYSKKADIPNISDLKDFKGIIKTTLDNKNNFYFIISDTEELMKIYL